MWHARLQQLEIYRTHSPRRLKPVSAQHTLALHRKQRIAIRSFLALITLKVLLDIHTFIF